jgi:hypothetical protein
MDQAVVHRIHKAVDAAMQAVRQAKNLDNCDVGDVDEAIEAIDQELGKPAPNKNTLTLYLNSVARSLKAVPAAEDARGEIEKALHFAGLPSTWNQ